MRGTSMRSLVALPPQTGSNVVRNLEGVKEKLLSLFQSPSCAESDTKVFEILVPPR